MNKPIHSVRFLGVAATIILLSGCNGAHLYNQSEDTIAKSAQADFSNAKIFSSLQAERTLVNQMQSRDLETVRQHTLAERDLALVTLLLPLPAKNTPTTKQDVEPAATQSSESGQTLDFFRDIIASRMNELMGSVQEPITKANAQKIVGPIAAIANGLPGEQERLSIQSQHYRIVFRRLLPKAVIPDVPVAVSADLIKDLSPDDIASLNAALKDYTVAKVPYDADVTALTRLTGTGDLVAITSQIADIDLANETIQKVVSDLSSEYDKTHKEQEAAASP